ncbi:globin domain-containing protein [Roseofilum sp. Belize BBD 4]|uniref:globin domain-containing protein n=1 Tax=unclassified Roseofilum TaxID=2620099 RepID=UPI00399FE60D
MMKQTTIDIVKATTPVVKEYGTQITQRMYEIAFEERPDIRRFFENTWMKDIEAGRKQARKLAASVYAYAQHIDQLDELSKAVERIAHVHVNSKILPETYPVIGECLIAAMKDVLGEAATPEILEAWTEAYGALADIFIQREQEIYKQEDGQMFSPKEAATH